MYEVLAPVLGTLIRHGLTTAGGGVLATAITGAGTTVEAVTGAILLIAGVVLSFVKNKKQPS